MAGEAFTVYQVWYWDPCNGMGGKSRDMGLFATPERAQEWIDGHRDPDPMEDNAYTIKPRQVM